MTETPDFGFCSHFPVLAAAVVRTGGPILELGCGYGSTPMLRMMSKTMCFLESYDSDIEWGKRFDVPVVENWNSWEPKEQHYGVAFIDCAPGEARKDLAVKLKDRATYIVLHDALCDTMHGGGGNYQYELILNQFKYVTFYRELRPHTLILSNEREFIL